MNVPLVSPICGGVPAITPASGERTQCRFEARFVGRFDDFEFDAEFLFGFEPAFVRGRVEGFVVTAAAVEHEPDFDRVRRRGRLGRGSEQDCQK
jgi:hypothetical protein